MSIERKELFDIILKKLRMPLGDYASAAAAFATDAVLAAGYRKPRVVSTGSELGEVPIGSIIQDYEGFAFQWIDLYPSIGWCKVGEELSVQPSLPATVLFIPEVKS